MFGTENVCWLTCFGLTWVIKISCCFFRLISILGEFNFVWFWTLFQDEVAYFSFPFNFELYYKASPNALSDPGEWCCTPDSMCKCLCMRMCTHLPPPPPPPPPRTHTHACTHWHTQTHTHTQRTDCLCVSDSVCVFCVCVCLNAHVCICVCVLLLWGGGGGVLCVCVCVCVCVCMSFSTLVHALYALYIVKFCTVADELPHFPIILIEVLSVDSWHRFFHEGYTYIQIPAKPGRYTAN